MTRTLWIFAALACLSPVVSEATDLPNRKVVMEPAGCLAAHRSPILDLASPGEMRGAVDQRLSAAIGVASSAATSASTTPLFTWANETKAYCGMAVGYFDGGEVNEATVTKCDCFYERMQRFVRAVR